MKKLTALCVPVCLALSACAFAGGPDAIPIPQATPPYATTTSGLYVGVEGGLAFVEGGLDFVLTPKVLGDYSDNFDTGFNIAGQIGYHFHNNLQAELEYRYFRTNTDSSNTYRLNVFLKSMHASLIMANILYNFNLGRSFCPHLGFGVGVALPGDSYSSYSQQYGYSTTNNSTFAFQAIAGIGYQLTQQIELYIDYRFVDITGDETWNQTSQSGPFPFKVPYPNVNLVNLGVTYNFY
jgi:opacity protein-like surface antigen